MKHIPNLRSFSQKQEGFTLIEILLTVSLALLLMSFATFNLSTTHNTTSIATAADMLIADIKKQQAKAINGTITQTGSSDIQNIYIIPNSNQYILFHGATYASDPTKFTVTLDDNLALSTTFPGGIITFSQLNGEVTGSPNTITLKHVGGNESEIITINRYGTITNLQ